MTGDSFDAEHYLDAMLSVAAIPLDPAWRADVLQHLRVAASMRAALEQAPLASNQLALAGVFSVSEPSNPSAPR